MRESDSGEVLAVLMAMRDVREPSTECRGGGGTRQRWSRGSVGAATKLSTAADAGRGRRGRDGGERGFTVVTGGRRCVW
jgi:hypothetical protein